MAHSASINLRVRHFNDPCASAAAALNVQTLHTLHHLGFTTKNLKYEEKYNLQIFYDAIKEQMCIYQKAVKV